MDMNTALAVIVGVAVVAGSDKTIQVRVSPAICSAPCTARAFLRFPEELSRNSQVCILLAKLTDDGFETRSCWPHYGQRAMEVRIRDVPSGSYVMHCYAEGGYAGSDRLRVVGLKGD